VYEERLTETIRDLERPDRGKNQGDLSYIMQSVVEHLERILNTRQGSVPIAEDYGMPDFTNFYGESLNNQSQEIAHLIQQMILKYEPRLQGIEVSFVPGADDLLALRFRLKAQLLVLQDRTVPIMLETVVSSDGKVMISK
jgi:type VI secretion system protein